LPAHYEGRGEDILPQRGSGSAGNARERAGNIGGSGAGTGKRWLRKRGKEYARLSPTLLGDDLYANRPFCEVGLKEKPRFIFVREPGSHPWLYETVENSYVKEKTAERRDGRYHISGTWRWLNGVPLRDTKDVHDTGAGGQGFQGSPEVCGTA
jgi:hypothetical protein